jgi:hypothetical protein
MDCIGVENLDVIDSFNVMAKMVLVMVPACASVEEHSDGQSKGSDLTALISGESEVY